jgi:hypothetical protein
MRPSARAVRGTHITEFPMYGIATDEHVVLPVPTGEHIVGVT